MVVHYPQTVHCERLALIYFLYTPKFEGITKFIISKSKEQ